MITNETNTNALSFEHMREVLNAIATFTGKKKIKRIAEEACTQITKFLGADSCAISLWDKEKGTLTLWAENYKKNEKIDPDWFTPYLLEDYPASQRVLISGKPEQIRIDNPAVDKNEIGLMRGIETKTLLMLPLFSGEEIIGLLEISINDRIRTFSENEIALATLFLNQVGIAIHHDTLLTDANQRTAELSAIRDVSLGMRSNQSFKDVLKVILKSTLDLFDDAMDAHVFIYENEKLKFGAALWADGNLSGSMADPREDGLTYTVARQAKIKVVEDIATHPLYINNPHNWQGAIIGLPLRNQGRVVGVMNLGFYHPRQFSKEVLQALTMLGDQAAVAIDRSNNIELIKKRASELEALRQANLILTESLDMNDVIDAVLKSALNFSDFSTDAHIFLLNGKDLVFGGALLPGGKRDTPWDTPREDGLTNRVAKSGKIIAIPDISKDELFSLDNHWKGEWTGSIVGIPIKIKDNVIGVINLAYNLPQEFSEDDMRSLALLADQAALAIENARLHKIVSQQAITDSLTGLPNRRAFELHLEQEVQRANRYGHPIILVMLDLNNFKWVNDNFGHPVGDETLKMVGECLTENIRSSDFVARMGGDEFGVILPETDLKSAVMVAKKLSKAIKAYSFPWWEGHEENYSVGITYGIASYPQDAKTYEELVLIADNNFYEAKEGKLRMG